VISDWDKSWQTSRLPMPKDLRSRLSRTTHSNKVIHIIITPETGVGVGGCSCKIQCLQVKVWRTNYLWLMWLVVVPETRLPTSLIIHPWESFQGKITHIKKLEEGEGRGLSMPPDPGNLHTLCCRFTPKPPRHSVPLSTMMGGW